MLLFQCCGASGEMNGKKYSEEQVSANIAFGGNGLSGTW
jgi:hypothetical protein